MVNEYKGHFENEWFQGFSNTISISHREVYASDYVVFQEPNNGKSYNTLTSIEFKLNTRFAYNEKLSVGKRQKDNSFQSFWSGHTSHSFMASVFTGYVFLTRYPNSKLVYPVWLCGLSLAAATGTLRVMSGNHFPTDSMVSAAVGSLIGWLIPRIHKAYNNTVVFQPYGLRGVRLIVTI